MLTMVMKVKNRYQAFGIHFLISFFIVINFSYLVFAQWYPEPFFTAEGGWSVFRIIVIVDLVLGPVLTLIVFKVGKKGLKFDLCVIATVQIVALAYGITILYQERPAYLAFSVDRFVVVSEHDIDRNKLKHPSLVNSKHNEEKPQLVFARLPEDPAERDKLTQEVFAGQPDLEYRAEYYESMEGNLENVMAKSKDIETLKNNPTVDKNKIDQFLKDHCQDGCGYFPLVGKKRDVLLAINKKNGRVAGGIDINPWIAPTPKMTTSQNAH